jgi:Putative Flp pilus-assembly TadE/G-like
MAERLRCAMRGLAHLRNRLREEHGQVLVIMTMAMTSLTLFTGIVLDIGIVMEERRQIQNAVDAASLAAARTARDNPGQTVAVAQQYLLLNGIDPADPDVNVTINTVYGADQVEITVSTAVPTAFFRIAGIDSKDVTVRAVGEALPLGAGNYAMVSLSETACDAFLGFGNPTLNIVGGGIMVNSNCPNYATNIYGNADIAAATLDYYYQGAAVVSGNAVTTPAPAPVSSPVTDPLAGTLPTPPMNVTSPDSGGTELAPAVRSISGNGAVTLNPGVYWGGLNILGNTDVTFSTGVYIIAGGDFETWGNGSITGTGVMVYLTGSPNPSDCGQISMYGNRVLDFTPASSGDYKDITFWQDENCTADFQYHGNVTGVHGVIYTPGARFDLLGNVDLGGIQVVSDTITIRGNTSINMNFTSYVGNMSTGKISLAE